ncbi:25504_t:CDS:2 [Dentiscutata erythropus]|uniref:25504_t:CDS:1 n=1 Tax=Dentiscutata erythropus TaxID=1348616 RepID=A0A9N9CPF1_9GLOM|nr:25504_t:CDS:2 [Dentiscutata erythropus]
MTMIVGWYDVNVFIRLTNEGTSYYVHLPSSNKSDFVQNMCNNIASAINCDTSQITMPIHYQYSKENDQIFMRVNIAKGNDRIASTLASELNEAITYKYNSAISNGTVSHYIDQSNGAWLMRLALLGLIWCYTCRSRFRGELSGKKIRRQYVMRNFFTILVSALIVMDFVLDILFIVFHRKDEKWITLVSYELKENLPYKKWWETNSHTVLALTLLSGLDNEALIVASSRIGILRTLNAPYSPEAEKWIMNATAFIIFIEDVPQFIFLTVYQNVTIIPAIVPILTLFSCRILIFIRVISIIYRAFFSIQEYQYDEEYDEEMDEEGISDINDVENPIEKYTENQFMDLSGESNFQSKRAHYVDEKGIVHARRGHIYVPESIAPAENIII